MYEYNECFIMNAPKLVLASLPLRHVWNSFVVLQNLHAILVELFHQKYPWILSFQICFYFCSYEVATGNRNNYNTPLKIMYSEVEKCVIEVTLRSTFLANWQSRRGSGAILPTSSSTCGAFWQLLQEFRQSTPINNMFISVCYLFY